MVVAGRNHNGAPSLAWERWHGTQQAYELDETMAGGAPPAREVADLELPQPDPVPPRLDLTSPSRIGPGFLVCTVEGGGQRRAWMLTVPNCSDMGDDSRDGGTVSYRRRQCCRMGDTAKAGLG
uniref:Uncharacterized protein n=3 Tax=Oryza TaxID=4527 RepID=Q8SAW3_ORYSJ|nr:Hypothetical protein [Oryza sativa Japonica Group]AAP52249.1 hypothetical protein LOC_Os10g07520 [Oryza sativa Japonica Group]